MIYVLTASDKGLFRLHPAQNQETNNNYISTPEIQVEQGRIHDEKILLKWKTGQIQKYTVDVLTSTNNL